MTDCRDAKYWTSNFELNQVALYVGHGHMKIRPRGCSTNALAGIVEASPYPPSVISTGGKWSWNRDPPGQVDESCSQVIPIQT